MDELILERSWMYNERGDGNSCSSDAFLRGVAFFLETAISRGQLSKGRKMRCPCSKCKNKKSLDVGSVESHLYTFGFIKDYYNWTLHGEDIASTTYERQENTPYGNEFYETYQYLPANEDYCSGVDSRFQDMVEDVAGPSYVAPIYQNDLPDVPNEVANKFYNIFQSSNDPVFEGCTSETELSLAMKLLQLKADHGMSEALFDSVCSIFGRVLDCDNKMPRSFQHATRLVGGLAMDYIRIDVCVRGCMIFYAEDEKLVECRFCGEQRFKPSRGTSSSNKYKRKARSEMFYLPIIPRLQRLFMNESTAPYMAWHAEPHRDRSNMIHPSDGESWKHFDSCYPSFAADARNVRLGLCSDGFSPFGMSSKSYSCWPIMITPYNLPPWMCMKTRFLWLTILIPGPDNPKSRIDMYMRPLIVDLIYLWNVGVDTYDSYQKENFNMRAALMWTVSDFPAYGMLSGWSTHGYLSCPICMEDTQTFYLKNGRKITFFDCHRRFLPHDHPYRYNTKAFRRGLVQNADPIPFRDGHNIYARVENLKYIWNQDLKENLPSFGVHHNWTKRSIFWDLPYWVNVKLRHNLDVMHVEKNVFENLFNTIMNVKDKTKDNGIKCRNDIAKYCYRPELESVGEKARYTLSIQQQVKVYEWIMGLKFPDGYAARLGNHVDLKNKKLMGYKSHDAHVFLERLMPIAFRGLLPNEIWECVSELCTFFRDTCASSIDIERTLHWKRNIVETLCKLEMFFPPSFFDSMEHLPLHVADEVLLGGPVQYRWMYPFERFIYRLKKMARNKAAIEASIVNAYIQLETTFLGSDYLGPEFKTNARRPKRNEIITGNSFDNTVSIYNYPGRGSKIIGRRNLTSKEFWKMSYYIMRNTPELDRYYDIFHEELRETHSDVDVYDATLKTFPGWLSEHIWRIRETTDIPSWIHDVSIGFDWKVTCTATYKINNYKFHTENHSNGRPTTNCHIHVKGTEGVHYYGILEEILHIRCKIAHRLQVVLFKCRWFDPNYVSEHPANGITEVNTKKLYKEYDPFILAQQAEQVYFTIFPGVSRKTRDGWVAVCRVKPTNAIDMNLVDIPFQEDGADDSPMPIVNEVTTFEPLGNVDVSAYDDDNDDPEEYDVEEDTSSEDLTEFTDTDNETV